MMKTMIAVIAAFSALDLVHAKELQYFDGKINFWNESPKSVAVEEQPHVKKSEEKSDFAWKTFLDPKNKEFFKEGDYTPPEPFMEVARNPNDENIKNWFDLMAKKNELAARLETRMREYMTRNDVASVSTLLPAPQMALRQVVPMKQIRVDASRFRIRMYFESTCPHCKRMFGVLKRLENEGFQVEAFQVDSGPVPESEKIVPLGKADPAELKKHGASGVPFLLVADVKRKALLPKVEGYHEYEEMMELMRAASRN